MLDRSSLQSLAGSLVAALAGVALAVGATSIAVSAADTYKSSSPPLELGVVWTSASLISFSLALASLFVERRRGAVLACSIAPIIALLGYVAVLQLPGEAEESQRPASAHREPAGNQTEDEQPEDDCADNRLLGRDQHPHHPNLARATDARAVPLPNTAENPVAPTPGLSQRRSIFAQPAVDLLPWLIEARTTGRSGCTHSSIPRMRPKPQGCGISC